MRFPFFLFFISLCFFLQGQDISSKQMERNLSILENTFLSHYAPAVWKKDSLSWSIKERFLSAKKEVQIRPFSLQEFHQLVRRIFRSTQDYHTNVYFHSTALSYLPFALQEVEGRVFVSWSDTEELNVGDEIIAWDRESINVVLDRFRQEEFSESTCKTEKNMAVFFLPIRLGLLGMKIPQGDIVLEVIPKNESEKQVLILTWTHREDEIPPLQRNSTSLQAHSLFLPKRDQKALKDHPSFQKHFEWAVHTRMKEAVKNIPHYFSLGSRDTFVPELGEILVASSPQDPIKAYLFLLPDQRKGGYLRIPDYYFSVHIKEIKEWIRLFEAAADVLVIDQVDNPGGSLFDVTCLLSLVAKEPISILKQKISLTQDEIASAVDMIKRLDDISSDEEASQLFGELFLGCSIDLQFIESLKNYFQELIDEWCLGNRLTSPLYLLGVDQIQPDPDYCFTKPIVVLINENSFSCGDFFPAIMQDSGRALLFGEKTAGAGGYVLMASYPNLAGINWYSYTGSLLQRKDGTFIEHVGVKPDVFCSPTAREVQTGVYDEYKAKLLEVINFLFSRGSSGTEGI